MKFMILVKATLDSEAGKLPPESLFADGRLPRGARQGGRPRRHHREQFALEDFSPAIERFRNIGIGE